MTHETLAAALAAFQAELPTVAKGNEAKVPTKNGGEYKYQYADLTDVTAAAMPVLSKHGLSFTSKPTMTENGFVLAYRLLHESGQEDAGEYPLPDPAHTQAQQMGSAITYARRYCLCAATGIAPGGDDDDAQQAQSAPPRGRRSPQQRSADLTARINAAASAMDQARTLAELDKVWSRVEAGGLAGIERLKSQHEDRLSDLEGTEPVDVDAAWAPQGDPGAATDLTNDEYEAKVAAEFDQAMALGDA